MIGTVRSAVGEHAQLLVVSASLFTTGFGAGVAGVGLVGVGGGGGSGGSPIPIQVGSILVQNLFVLGVVLLGAVTLGLATVVTLWYNGFLVGVAMGAAATKGSLGVALLAVAPHGVVEYPAFVVGGAAALRLPTQLVEYLRGRRDRPFDPASLADSVLLVGVAVLLLVVGAVIEATVTPRLV